MPPAPPPGARASSPAYQQHSNGAASRAGTPALQRGLMNRKNAELAKIHIAKKQLAMSDDAYRALLDSVAGVASSKDLSPKGRADVLERMKTLGFDGKKRYPGRPNTIAGNPQLQKIEALLADAKRPWTYLTAKGKTPSLLERLTGKQRLEFCSSVDLGKVIAALEIDRRRREEKQHAGV